MKSFRGIVKGILLRALGIDPVDNLEGSVWHNGSDHRLKTYLESDIREIVTDTQSQELENKIIDATKNQIINIPASDILYDPSQSELNATNVQDAIDELKENITFNPTSVIYVDANRLDTYTEIGTIIYPYKTIQAAIDAATPVSIIKVQGGDYFENLIFDNKENIQLEGYSVIDAGGVGIYGQITVNNGSTRIKFKGLNVYNNAGTALHVEGSLSRIYIQDVTFNGNVIFNDSTNWVVIDNSDINGNLDITHTGSAQSFTLFMNHHAGSSVNISIDNPNASFIASQCYNIKSISHINGNVSLFGVNNMHGDILSTSDTGILKIDNVSLQKPDLTYHIISKTGTCPYIISKTNRDISSDVLNGIRASYAQPSKDIEFDNTSSGLSANNVQDAITEVTSTFGKVLSVNGMTGEVELEAVNIPFDNSGTGIVSSDVQGALSELASGVGGGKGIQTVDLYDPLSTVLPSGTTAVIDGVTLVDGQQILFSNLNVGNNRVYEVSGVGTSLTFTPVEIFNGSFDPSLADLIVIKSGDLFNLQIGTFTSTTWDFNDTIRQFNGVDYVETSSLKTVTLLDGQTTEVFSVEPSGSENFVIDVSLDRNGQKEVSTLHLTTNGIDCSVNRIGTSTSSIGVDFSASVGGLSPITLESPTLSGNSVMLLNNDNYAISQRFIMTNPVVMDSVTFYMICPRPPGASGVGQAHVVIYNDNVGSPGSVVYTSPLVDLEHIGDIPSNATAVQFDLEETSLLPGTYWIGVQSVNLNPSYTLYVKNETYIDSSYIISYTANGVSWTNSQNYMLYILKYDELTPSDLKLLATATSTGSNTTMKFSYKRWSDLPGGPAAVPSYSGVTLELDAENIDYDNSSSGLAATNLQEAVDELAAGGGGGGGSGANTSLSNLTPTAINQHLVPNDINKNLGSESLPFNNLYVNNIIENAHSQSIVNNTTIDLSGTEFGVDYKSLEFQYYINRTGIFNTSPYDWESNSIPFSGAYSLTYGNGLFVASLNSNTGVNDVAISSDGVLWEIHSSGLTKANSNIEVVFGNGVFVRRGSSSTVQVSSDGIIWSSITLPANIVSQQVSFANGEFVLIHSNRKITSIDGVSWTETIMTSSVSNVNDYRVIYGNGVYIACSFGSNSTYVSNDMLNWSLISRTLLYDSKRSVIFAFGKFYYINNINTVYSSIDGVTWDEEYTIMGGGGGYKLGYTNNNLLAINTGGSNYVVSPDGINFYETSSTAFSVRDIETGEGKFVALGTNPQVNYTQIGVTDNRIKDGKFNIYYDDYFDVYRAYSFSNGGDNSVGIRFQVNNTTKMITMITDYIADQVSGNIRYKLVRKL